jgi:hypothetical protein
MTTSAPGLTIASGALPTVDMKQFVRSVGNRTASTGIHRAAGGTICFLSVCRPLSAALALGFLDMSLQAMQYIAPMGVAERQMGVILRPFTVRQRHNRAAAGI